MNIARGRGRPRGTTQAREQILQSARRLFLEGGYTRVTMRAIAADAGVDSALVSYYFGSKRGLFSAVMELMISPPDMVRHALDGDPAHLPERILTAVLASWDDPVTGPPLIALYRSIGTDPDATRLVRELIEREIVEVLAEYLGGGRASARAGIASSLIAGLILMRYVLQAEPVASMSPDEVVGRATPMLRVAFFSRPGPR